MKFLKVYFLICVSLFHLASCSSTQKETLKDKPPHSGLFPILQNGKFGYIDASGSVVINPQFDFGDEFYEDLARVEIGGKVGLIDRNGKFVLTPQFDYIGKFSENLAFARIDKKVSVVDKTGNFVITSQFDGLNDNWKFSDGVAPVRVGDRIGFIDTTGKFVVNPQFMEAGSISDGLAYVTVGSRDTDGYLTENSKCGYIDKTGQFIINPQFLICRDFVDGITKVGQGASKKSYSWVTIDKTGKIIPDDKSYYTSGVFFEGLSVACKEPVSSPKQNCGYIDKSGNWVIQPQFDRADNFYEGLAAVAFVTDNLGNDKKWGYIDKTGKLVISPQFYEAKQFWGGLASVKPENSGDKKFGYIDKTGKYIWNPTN